MDESSLACHGARYFGGYARGWDAYPRTYSAWGRRGKLACAPGAYGAQEAGTRGPYVPHGGPGGKWRARVSVGLHFLSATTVAGEHSPSVAGGSRGALESEEARRRSSSVGHSARITCERGGHKLRSRRAGGWRRAHPTLRVRVRLGLGLGSA